VLFQQTFFLKKIDFLVNDFFPKIREIVTENSLFKVFFSKWKKVATEIEKKLLHVCM
jgi:hypothetical protein